MIADAGERRAVRSLVWKAISHCRKSSKKGGVGFGKPDPFHSEALLRAIGVRTHDAELGQSGRVSRVNVVFDRHVSAEKPLELS